MALTRITKGVIKPNENYDTHNINSTGIITAVGGNFSGNVSVGGVLTYEDVTSIDSVGIITAQKDIHVGAGVSAVGVGTFGSLDISGDIDVDGHTNLDNVNIAGVTTTGGNLFVGGNIEIPSSGKSIKIWTGGTQGIIINHGGTYGVIDNLTGTMRISAGQIKLLNRFGNLDMLTCNSFGSVDLFHNNILRFTTTGYGVSTTGLEVVGVSTFTGAIDANGDLDVDGHTNLDNVSIAGVSTFTGEIDHNSTLTTVKLKVNSTNAQIDLTSGQNSFTRYGAINHYHNNSTSTIHNQIKLAPRNGGTGRIMFYNLTGGSLTERLRIDGTDGIQAIAHITPMTDSTYNLGSNGTRFANVYADTYYGDGSNLSNITSTTINNNADNRIITGSGTANTLEAEPKLTFDGTGLLHLNNSTGSSEAVLKLESESGSDARLILDTSNGGGAGAHIDFQIDGTSKGGIQYVTNGSASDQHDIIFRNNTYAEKVRITSTGKVTFTTPGGDDALLIKGDNYTSVRVQSARNSDSDHAMFQMLGSRGTNASPTIVQSGDTLGTLSARGYDGNSYASSSNINFGVDGTPGDGDMPGRITFSTAADGSESPTERLRITSSGAVMINTTNSSARTLNLRGNFGILSVSQTGVMTMDVTDAGVATIAPFVAGGSTLILKTNVSGSGVAERLRIQSNGDVIWNGIGTQLPGAGNSTVGMGFEPRNGTIFLSRGDNATILSNRNNDGRHIHFNQGGTEKFAIGLQNSGADLAFFSGAGNSPTERLRINSNGRVNIGDTNHTNNDLDYCRLSIYGQTSQNGTNKNLNLLNVYNYGSGNPGDITGIGLGAAASPDYTKASLAFIRTSSYGRGDLIFCINSEGNANMVTESDERLRIDGSGRIGSQHNLSGVADYNRLMLHNPNSGSCWMQLTSTATGSTPNTDGLSIGLNTSNIAHFWLRENADIYVGTNNTRRWTITSSGDLYPQGNYNIGLNSNTAFRMNEVNSNKFVHRYGTSGSATNNQTEAIWYGGGITVMHDYATLQTTNYTWGLTGSRGYPLIRIRNNSSGGAIYAENGTISSGSDYRMKENIEEITNGIETVKKLKPSIYNIRKSFNPNDDGKKHHGFIAHEVQEAIPNIGNIVSGTKDGMEEVFYGVNEDDVIPEGKKAGDSTGTFTDKPDMQGIDYGHMTPVLAAAIKELIAKVESLEAEVASLKST